MPDMSKEKVKENETIPAIKFGNKKVKEILLENSGGWNC
jgi:hypothetical protein